MICPKKVQDMCLFGMMCPREAVVDDDGECAAFINKTLGALDGALTKMPDPVEAAEVRAERFAIVDEIFEGNDWRKNNPTLRGAQTPPPRNPPPMPHLPLPEKKEPALCTVTPKAPLMCRIAHWLCGESPSALFAGCRLGRRRVFYKDCILCPEYRGPFRIGKAKKGAK